MTSISRRLVLWLAVPLTLLALGGALVHYFNSIAPGVITSDRRLRDAAADIIAHIKVVDDQLVLDSVPVDDSVKYAVRDAKGRLFAGDARLPTIPIASGGLNQAIGMAPINRGSVRTLTVRAFTPRGPVLVNVADAVKVNEAAARFGFMSTLLWDFVQLDLTLVLVWVGIQLGLRPVKRMRDEIADRSPLDLRPIAEASVPRELAPLAATLNRLFLLLRTSVQSQQQFIANTAHQLRTPITGMLAQLDLLTNEPAALPIHHRLLVLQEGMRQLTQTANQLLTLARADPAVNITTKNRSVNLKDIVAEVAARFYDRALQSQIDLGVETENVSVIADPTLLDDLLSNLVDNAIKYTPAGGRVTVRTGLFEGRPTLSVEDTGVGIPDTERQRVRQRFYRMPHSTGHGSGLGLAIVEEIARLYGAVMTIDTGPGGLGSEIRLQFR